MNETMRLDQLLVYLRFARTRTRARDIIEGKGLRLNRKHVARVSQSVGIGDVLTLALGNEVRIIEVLSLPERRSSAELARTHYRELDRNG